MAATKKVWKIYQEYIDLDLLEDRREYSINDHQRQHNLTMSDATTLYKLVQTHFTEKAKSLYRSHWDEKDALELAINITEAMHQGLDGWSDQEKVVITLFLHDLAVAQYYSEGGK